MINRTAWIITGVLGVLGVGAGPALAAAPFSIPGADSARVTDTAPVSVGVKTSPSTLCPDPLPARPAVPAVAAVPARRAVPAPRPVPVNVSEHEHYVVTGH